jgi:DNA-binding NarL/FixJ family response regulator
MKILVCDDHALFREGLRLVLKEVDADAEIIEAAEGEEALSIVANDDDIDLLLLDLNMPGMDGWISLRRLRSRYPAIPVAIVSASETPGDVKNALDSGAAGFIPKSSKSTELAKAVRSVLDGEIYVPQGLPAAGPRREAPSDRLGSLTDREREIIALLSKGRTSRQIAEELDLPEEEVASRIASALGTLDIKTA